MTKTSQDYEKEFLSQIVPLTGKDLNAWMAVLKDSGLAKAPDMIAMLRETYNLQYNYANMLSAIYRNGGKPVYADMGGMLDALFEKKPTLRPLYETLESRLREAVPDLTVVPAKSYVSFRVGREFACATPMKDRLRVGMDLGSLPFDDYLLPAKSLGAMPRLGHMVEVTADSEINERLLGYLVQANRRVNGC
jgi:predicted transport protein